MKSVKVNSEIGRLKKVLLHEPGDELHNLTPKKLDDLLFDDIPWLWTGSCPSRPHRCPGKAIPVSSARKNRISPVSSSRFRQT